MIFEYEDRIDALKELFVSYNLNIVAKLSVRFWKHDKSVSLDELFSEGSMKLLDCVDNFDYRLNNKFSTYAMQALKRHFLHLYEESHKLSKREKYSLERIVFNDGKRVRFLKDIVPEKSATNGEVVQRGELPKIVNNYIEEAGLTEQERGVIQMRFGLNGYSSKGLQKTGNILNLTKERIRQIQNNALSKLKQVIPVNLAFDS